MRTIKLEYGFESVNGIVKKVYELSEVPRIAEICDVWNALPLRYVRQFTGLHDKNGRDIYEGDIVGVDCSSIGGAFYDGVYTVGYFLPDCGFALEQLDKKHAIGFNECDIYEILGNIHENPETIGQFTGLHDKNGREIYEGDIVVVDCSSIGGAFYDGVYTVRYFLPDCGFALEQLDKKSAIGFNECDIYEILGNIHENPELIQR